MRAIEQKLSEQRRFVLWWDGQEKAREGGRTPKTNRVVDQPRDLATLADLGLDRNTVHRWRVRLKDEKKFDAALEQAQARGIRVCEFRKGQTDQRGAVTLTRQARCGRCGWRAE